MASFTRGLGLVLTVCMVATRPSSAIRAGSPDSGHWWETTDFNDLIQSARTLRAAHDFAGLESIYLQGYRRAKTMGNVPAEIGYLGNLGTARLVSQQYAAALEAYLEANALAERTGDRTAAGGIALNLSLVYQRMGDPNSALSALERGRTAIDLLGRTSADRRQVPQYKAQLLMSLRNTREALHETLTGPSYKDAIEAARQTGDAEVEAAAWDLLSKEYVAAGLLERAEASLGQALRLRTSHSPRTLGFSYAALGALRLAQAGRAVGEERRRKATEAEELTERAIVSWFPGQAHYALIHQRGLIREALGKTDLALADYSAAVDEATELNGAVPAALSLMIGANVAMQHETFDSFVEAAARQALRTGDLKWAADGFVALEANRAASLRESRELAPVWKTKLPRAYWETLGRLNDAETRDLGTAGTMSARAKRLRLELTEMESTAGIGVSVMLTENFRTRSSLIHFQQGLDKSDLVLSFYLGKNESYLWAVTQGSIAVHRLPAEPEIREEVHRFREAIISGMPAGDNPLAGEKLGSDLYQRLLGTLGTSDLAKKSWLLSLDGALFDLPFAALVSGFENGRPVYVAEKHSLQCIPGALFLNRSSPRATRPERYLGVADPVYNAADPRWMPQPNRNFGWSPHTLPTTLEGTGQLNRLVNSGRELRRSSQNWQDDTGAARPMELLQGPGAKREAFLESLSTAPSTIHLATHVLAPATVASGTQSEQAFLAFSLESTGRPGLLSTSEIGMLHVPGALIVMTGCATATGEVRAGTGLLGLTRAWMMAGARAVVATNWPVEDADGDLIPAFYQHLHANSAAEALRRSQVEMIHSGTWQASPSYWAAFQIAGGSL